MGVLGTKIHIPAARPNLVPRPRLTGRMSPDHLPRLVLVCAPAGFGKTTLLTQWLTASNAPDLQIAWVSLDEGDNDPHRFLEHVVAAFIAVRDLPEAAQLLADGATPPALAVLTSVVNELDLLPGRTVLALDDYHVIDSPDVHALLTFLVDHLPPHVSLAVATRADPPLPLPRLRARGELLEMRAADLRFTEREARDFLDQVMGLDLTSGDVSALAARTEGWAAGLQLAGLSLQGVDDTGTFVNAFAGTHRFVLDYLVEEVLAHQPDNIRRFLLETSILDEMTATLADAVTSRDDGQAVLEQLDRANLFVVPLDDTRTWYRYHHLFGEALHARLVAADPERAAELHGAASRWCATHDRPEEAVRHALAGRDPEHAADVVEWALPDLRRARHHDRQIRDWLTALPDESVGTRPLLAAYRAWTRLVEGDLAGVETWLRRAEEASTTNPPHPRSDASPATVEELRTLPATISVFRASVAQAQGDTEESRRQARAALALIGPQDHMARGGAAGFLGMAAWARGDLEEAVTTFQDAMRALAAAGDVADELGGTVVLGGMWTARGRPDRARSLFERALTTAQAHPGAALATLGDLHVGLAEVLGEQAHLDPANEHLAAAAVLGDTASLLENRHRWAVVSARLHRARGNLDGATDLLEQAGALYRPGFFPDVRPIPAQLARIHIAQGRLTQAQEWAEQAGVQDATTGEYLDEFKQLTFVRLLLAQHRAGPAAGLLDEAETRLDRIAPGAVRGGRGASTMDVHLMRALVNDARGDRPAALTDLAIALTLGVPAGFVQHFLDEGEALTSLLVAAERHPAAGEHVRTLRTASLRTATSTEGNTDEVLSERELEVLRLLATALSGPDIARELFVSVNTLRTHTKHIFTKLDVNTRRAAVERARDRGLT
jgi:LuxR family maltose regulon positive regulatory protein